MKLIGLIRFIVSLIINAIYRVEVIGKDNVPSKGSALLCANHNRMLDMFLIGYKINRLVHYMAKEELFKIPIISSIIRFLGAFPVKRGSGDVRAVKTALELLRKGHIVGIFPEGTRTRGKFKNNIKIKPGAALLAIKSGVPIVPVAIKGSYKPFSNMKVVFGQPIILDADKNKKYTVEEMAQISTKIMKKIYCLMEAT